MHNRTAPKTCFTGRLVSILPLFLLLALSLQPGDALSADETAELDLLAPPATASPRDTLRGFLTYANQVAEQKQQGSFDAEAYHVLRRAVDRREVSSMPHGDDWSERLLRAALLHEVLGRVELPPEAQIPDLEDVEFNPYFKKKNK